MSLHDVAGVKAQRQAFIPAMQMGLIGQIDLGYWGDKRGEQDFHKTWVYEAMESIWY